MATTEGTILFIPRTQARDQLLSRIQIGEALRDREITNNDELEAAREENYRWDSYNQDLLGQMFNTKAHAYAYKSSDNYKKIVYTTYTLSVAISQLKLSLSQKISNLISLAERLDLIKEKEGLKVDASLPARPGDSAPVNNKIFLVHGQDEEAKAIVARFIESCGLTAIILHERADQGRTIIEKFEQEADVGFAVILLTPDDVGGLKAPGDPLSSGALKLRARQNVVLELGYFIGRLGRSRVCALRKGDTELPSDISGVVYTTLGADDGWKVRLAKELRTAGYDVDLNKVLG